VRLILAAALALAPAPGRAETAGAALFLRGEGAEVRLGTGDTVLPAARFACARCHGADGQGGREGATVFPPVDWAALTDPARPTPYDAAALGRALADGIAPDGSALSVAMPRYRLLPGAQAALAAHLDALSVAARQGILPDAILSTRSGDAALDAGALAAFETANRGGGAWGRRFLLVEAGGAVDLADLVRARDAAAADAILAPLLSEIRRAGHRALAVAGPRPPGLAAALAAAGLAETGKSDVLLLLGPPPADLPRDAAVFGPADALGPALPELLAAGHRVTLAVPDRAALAWAAATGGTAQAAAGYRAAASLVAAGRAGGRAVTAPALAAAARTQPVQVEVLRFP
jgi:hypothetical protein